MREVVRPSVALLIEASRTYGRGLLRGVASFARTHSNWSLLHEEMLIESGVPPWMERSTVDGVIGRIDRKIAEPLRSLRIPVVDVLCSLPISDMPQVDTDDQSVCELAFEHLWEQGFRRFAFCGFRGAHYSQNRLSHFSKLATERKCLLSTYETDHRDASSLKTIERAGLTDVKQLCDWLISLKPPCGLFACNDIRGQQVLNACNRAGVLVPDDVAVIGVDDDDVICPLSDPPLTSVKPDTELIGFKAAEILASMMRGEQLRRTKVLVPPLKVNQRLSTQAVATEDREIARVCRFIREHACDGIDVSDVVEFSVLSRRQLERRFRDSMHASPHDFLTATQVYRVKQLLTDSEMTLEQLAPLAGYSHKERLSAVFKRATGEAPGSYRMRMRQSSSVKDDERR
ncbi:MAG TPA: AraC family transcriptional regulator [Planctomycetaceae bacterium]|nr:AraC family transcriptional regulator [Planctomycetaceae bacterium]